MEKRICKCCNVSRVMDFLKRYFAKKMKQCATNPVQQTNFDIQSNIIDLSTRLWGINPTNSVVIPQSLVLRSVVLD